MNLRSSILLMNYMGFHLSLRFGILIGLLKMITNIWTQLSGSCQVLGKSRAQACGELRSIHPIRGLLRKRMTSMLLPQLLANSRGSFHSNFLRFMRKITKGGKTLIFGLEEVFRWLRIKFIRSDMVIMRLVKIIPIRVGGIPCNFRRSMLRP